jgi:uncharacterized repeat protein (TIGR01451 family)
MQRISALYGRRLVVVLALLLVTASAVISATVGKPLLKVNISGEVSRDGRNLSLTDLKGGVSPGEVITWHMRVANEGNSATPSVTSIDGEISSATVFIPGSATGDGSPSVSYSIDGGKNFSSRPMVRYVENGQSKERPAPVESYTHIRFIWQNGFNPGDARSVRYQARVR